MSLTKRSTSLCSLVLSFLILVTPSLCFGFTGLDIFYSNDVSGHTEPCG